MTTPPTAYTAELESMIAIMSGDFQEARRWILRIPVADRPEWIGQLRQLIVLAEQVERDGGS